MRKRIGIVLCGIGIVLVLAGILLLKNSQSNKQYKTSTQEDTEQVYEETNATTQVMADKETSTQQETQSTQQTTENRKQSAHDINPDVYEWPCGNKRFKDYEEPEEVIEFAKHKEYYDQIAEQFLEYEGKDIYFFADKDMLHFDECKNEGSVKFQYDKEKFMDLFKKSELDSITAIKNTIIFEINVNFRNCILYYYDETLTYDDPLPSDEEDIISHYRMVNIAPHWWWNTSGPGA